MCWRSVTRCTGQNCKALALLRDPGRVRSNLSAQTLDRYLDHYQEVWAKASEATPAEVAQVQPNASAPHKLVNIDFPSAASIPPVSIMNPEPTGPVLPGVAAAAAANPNPQASAAAVAAVAQASRQSAGAGCRSTDTRRLGCYRTGWPEPAPAAAPDRLRHPPAPRFSSIRPRPAQASADRCGRNELSVSRGGRGRFFGDVQLSPHCQSRRNRLPHRAHRQTARAADDRGLFGSGCACAASKALR